MAKSTKVPRTKVPFLVHLCVSLCLSHKAPARSLKPTNSDLVRRMLGVRDLFEKLGRKIGGEKGGFWAVYLQRFEILRTFAIQ